MFHFGIALIGILALQVFLVFVYWSCFLHVSERMSFLQKTGAGVAILCGIIIVPISCLSIGGFLLGPVRYVPVASAVVLCGAGVLLAPYGLIPGLAFSHLSHVLKGPPHDPSPRSFLIFMTVSLRILSLSMAAILMILGYLFMTFMWL